jgi:hypothetical protein
LPIHRPIGVWFIFVCSIAVAGYAAWAWLALVTTGHSGAVTAADYGSLGLVASLIPAVVVLAVGLSMIALTKWAIAATGLNVFVGLSFFSIDSSPTTIIWLFVSLAMFAYAIWLRRKGMLT